jgi:hypothetical protein
LEYLIGRGACRFLLGFRVLVYIRLVYTRLSLYILRASRQPQQLGLGDDFTDGDGGVKQVRSVEALREAKLVVGHTLRDLLHHILQRRLLLFSTYILGLSDLV